MSIIHIIRGNTYDSFHIIDSERNLEYIRDSGELKPVLCSIPYRNSPKLLVHVRSRYKKEMKKGKVDLHDLISIVLLEYNKELEFPILL